MTPEIWTIIGVGIALGTLSIAQNRALRRDLGGRMDRLEASQNEQGKESATLRGRLDTLIEILVHDRTA